MIKVLGITQKRGKESDTRLAWFMFYKIYRVYNDLKNKEEINADMLLPSMSEHKEEYMEQGQMYLQVLSR